jgi:hypothetical protein
MAREVLLLFALDEPTEDGFEAMARLVSKLNEERLWSRGPIEFVNEVDESSVSQPGDLPVQTVGGLLRLRRVEDSPAAVEQAQLDDIEFLIDRLCAFTAGARALVIEYDGEEVGAIENGEIDRSLRIGLLGNSQ